MKHLDLFSGIGGFALAAEMVWQNVEHTFVEYDPFCQAVLRKHWPDAEIHGDIRSFAASANASHYDLLTGGFPCQPFSHAGRRQGTDDDRYLWPPMLECIKLFKPTWVIAENVAGLASWNEGVVLETVCSDLEKEGYEVQPFVIPACAVNAPHRRDRIWIVGNAKHDGLNGSENGQGSSAGNDSNKTGAYKVLKSSRPNLSRDSDATDSERSRHEGEVNQAGQSTGCNRGRLQVQWTENWHEVAARLCRMDDGVPRRLDRNPRLKSLGNAIVPQVAAEIMQAIKYAGEN